jgi:hypothetical protein
MINLTLTANSPEELTKVIKDLAASYGAPAKETKTDKAAPVKSETPAEKKTPAEVKAPDPEVNAAADDNTGSAPEKNAASKEPEKEITLEEVRAKLAALSQSGKQAQVKALISKFGASKLTDIPKEKYAELMKEAEAI